MKGLPALDNERDVVEVCCRHRLSDSKGLSNTPRRPGRSLEPDAAGSPRADRLDDHSPLPHGIVEGIAGSSGTAAASIASAAAPPCPKLEYNGSNGKQQERNIHQDPPGVCCRVAGAFIHAPRRKRLPLPQCLRIILCRENRRYCSIRSGVEGLSPTSVVGRITQAVPSASTAAVAGKSCRADLMRLAPAFPVHGDGRMRRPPRGCRSGSSPGCCSRGWMPFARQ